MFTHRITPCLAALALLAACGGSATPAPSAPKASLATASAGALTVELLTDTRLETGLTPVYLKVSDAAGAPVTDATVTLAPLMTMMGTMPMTHGAPVASAPALASDGLYHGAIVFQMASSDMGAWSAKVTVQRPGSAAVEATFPTLTVTETGRAKVFKFTDPSTSAVTKYVASMNFEAAPKVGLNPIVVTMHEMKDMMTFAPCDDMAIALDPEMPAMGHGSPGSVDPVLASPGRYEGKLSFSMPGDWQTTLTMTHAGTVVGSVQILATF